VNPDFSSTRIEASIVARGATVERVGSNLRRNSCNAKGCDLATPVLTADPVRHLSLPVELEARDVTHGSALGLHDLVRRAPIASQPCPACVEGVTVVGIRRGEGGHPDRLAVGCMLEQRVEVPVIDVAKHNLRWRRLHERRR
jgi:hypothetical protein